MEQWPPTQHSLLVRIRDAHDQEAWCRFVDVYGPVLYQYARRQGLQDADAADVMQDVMRRVSKAIPESRYDARQGTFRGWLFTVARNSLRNYLAASARRESGSGSTTYHQLLEQLPAETEESRIWDDEYAWHVFRAAAERSRDGFSENSWQAFWQTAVEVKNVKDVARSLGMSVGAVYVARSRVLARIRQEVEMLEASD